MQTNSSLSRKSFLKTISLAGVGFTIPNSFKTCIKANGSKKLGVALVGLGNYSTYQLAPALLKTNNCYLAGIVTGTREKENIWSEKYGIKKGNIYNYNNFDSIKDNSDIDIVYVVLPVAMHKDFVIRAAKAKKNVICEKPLAMNVSECFEMIESCKSNGVKFSVGYRLHFEPFTQEIMRLGQEKSFGKIQNIVTSNGFVYSGPTNNWRLKKGMAGGGGLMDMGIYALHAARFVIGEMPSYVLAREEKNKPDLFSEVDETIYWQMEFPSGAVANCKSSYNGDGNSIRAEAVNGWFELSQAYRYKGMRGGSSMGAFNFNPDFNQQAAQMDDFANCIYKDLETKVPGEMGLDDMRIIEAIYRSISIGAKSKV